MNISIPDVKCTVIAHKFAISVEYPELRESFKIVIDEVLNKTTGESLGWVALPEIQLRQTVELKQEYIMSNANPTPEEAVKECILKMLMASSREVFYKPDFAERNNILWED